MRTQAIGWKWGRRGDDSAWKKGSGGEGRRRRKKMEERRGEVGTIQNVTAAQRCQKQVFPTTPDCCITLRKYAY